MKIKMMEEKKGSEKLINWAMNYWFITALKFKLFWPNFNDAAAYCTFSSLSLVDLKITTHN